MHLTDTTRRTVIICALLGAATLAAYWPVTGCAFLNYDDNVFVTQNPQVTGGLSRASVVWAFHTGLGGNWQPLTWLSHLLDVQLFGLKPGWHHFINLLFHLVNALLLYLLLQRSTGAAWRSAAVAGLFALHPLHVESVAWVAERKDVLSGFFFMLTLWAYVRYAQVQSLESGVPSPESVISDQSSAISGDQTTDHGPRTTQPASPVTRHATRAWFFYALALLFHALGLMSKPMLVTVPFVMLLLDYWPLGRLQISPHAPRPTALRPLLLEKLPFFALSAASSVVAFLVQRASESVYPLEALPLTQRAMNALVAYAAYLEQTFWPVGLAVLYPLPHTLPASTVIISGALLLGLTLWAVASVQRGPYVTVGWFWYLGMLVPVIGLVQVGWQARADRYTYLPLIGVFIAMVWTAVELCQRWRGRPRGLRARMVWSLAAAVVLLACGLRTRDQLRHWRSSENLFRQATAVTKDNWLAHYNLAGSLRDQQRFDEAVTEYERAIGIHPDYVHAHINLGNLLLRRGQVDEAIGHWRKALEIRPKDAPTHNNLATALLGRGQVDEAITHLQQALESDPGLAIAHNSLGNALLRKGQLDEAIKHFQEAVKLRPDFARALCSLGGALLRKGRVTEARAHYQAAVAVQPATAPVLTTVAWALATCPAPGVRDGPRAVELAEQAWRLAGDANPAVLGTLAAAYAETGRFPEAVTAAQRALGLATAQGNPRQAEVLRSQLALYQNSTPFRDHSLAQP